MSYSELLKISNILNPNERLKKYASYYKSKELTGLYYVYFALKENTLAICDPDHSTNHYSTSYLLTRKYTGVPINTVRSEANDLKKFLDYLYIWEIDIMSGDLLVILEGFVDYLRLLDSDLNIQNVVEWSLVTKVPLNETARNLGKVVKVSSSDKSHLVVLDWAELNPKTIRKTLTTTIKYIEFLKRRTNKYFETDLHQLPIKQKIVNGLIVGTSGTIKTTHYDVQAIMRNLNIQTEKRFIESLPFNSIFTEEQLNCFFSEINNNQDKLMFSILRYMGLRAAEVAGLKIDFSTMPNGFLTMDYFTAKNYLKTSFVSDIELFRHPDRDFWVCNVIDRDNEDHRSGHKKTGENRSIPWLFGQELFLDLLYLALIERQILIRHASSDHGYLFVSRDRKAIGRPITGQSVAKKFETISKRLKRKKELDLTMYSPHTFRHFFATYLLKELKYQIDDVSRWLGHSSINITRDTYLHWLPSQTESEGKISDITKVIQDSLIRGE
ncbi:site-specific integrase [Alkalihalobacillus sp. BA299]|uniref:tyrosine-type recombinase/integrase n=1 Tax=Alkalihalobacillus sp. BA299 TaxID=2815938 RepID=UPI001ADA43FF|nr:site-specific integrase [Alkalihalobacillus sp. BA299]